MMIIKVVYGDMHTKKALSSKLMQVNTAVPVFRQIINVS